MNRGEADFPFWSNDYTDIYGELVLIFFDPKHQVRVYEEYWTVTMTANMMVIPGCTNWEWAWA